MIGSELDKLITNKEWTFNDILNMDKTVDDLVQQLIDGMDSQTKYDFVKNLRVRIKGTKYDIPVKEVISDMLREKLSETVSVTINEYLKTATVNLSKENPEITEVVNEEKVDKPKEDKIVSLKEQIKKDVKQLDNKEMKEKGMI